MDPVQGHVCPPVKKGALPFDAYKAAKFGDVEKVKSFVDGGGDVNAGDANGFTMIYAACENGRTEVVKVLLNRTDIHLNTRHMGITTLAVASCNGHGECVKLLLGYTGKCDLNLQIKSTFRNNKPFSALSTSAQTKHWNIFNILLKETKVIYREEIPDILNSALNDDQWNIIEEFLQKNIRYVDGVFYRLLREAFARQLWHIIQVVFQRSLLHENNFVLPILSEMYHGKDWNNLESLLKCVTQTLRIDIPVAEALQNTQHQEVEGMLKEKNFDADTMSGIFLLACIGGTSEEVAQVLMSSVSNYTDETLKYGLLLSSIFNRLELLTPLLQSDSFSYKTINGALCSAVSYRCTDAMKLLKLSLNDKTCGIFPKMMNRLKLDITNGAITEDARDK